MKRLLTTVVVIFCLVLLGSAAAQPPQGHEGYAFTISASLASPDANQIPFAPGILSAFLWLKCCRLPSWMEQGIAGVEFGVTSTNPANVILAFTPVFPWLDCGSILLCAADCPCWNSLVGRWTILMNAPGSFCLGPSTTGTLAGVDCSENPSLWPIDWIGLDSGGGGCWNGPLLCDLISVEGRSWGSVKSLYR
jgi:hypothetical protein